MTNEREHLHYLVPVFWTISLATLFCQISTEMNFSLGDKVVKGDRLYKHLATHPLKGGCPETFSREKRMFKNIIPRSNYCTVPNNYEMGEITIN
jgi:hypothetical protein